MIRLISNELKRDSRGSAAVEFALVLPVLFTVIIASMDIAYKGFIHATLQGAVQKVARDGTLQTGAGQISALDAKVQNIVTPIVNNGTFTFTRRYYEAFTKAAQAESFTDSNGNGIRNTGECFQDENGNGTWDADAGRSGLGGSKDVVVYTASVSYPRLFPMKGLLGWSPTQVVSATTVLRNQPFGNQVTYTVQAICT